ncbi:MAG TPA: hypothetical protein VF710_05080, partial [Longimicrobium sp.]
MRRIALALLPLAAACAAPRPVVVPTPTPMLAPVAVLTPASPREVGMLATLPARLDSIANDAI